MIIHLDKDFIGLISGILITMAFGFILAAYAMNDDESKL
jgi:hypothetical protein